MIKIEYRSRISNNTTFQYQTRYSSGADLIAQEEVMVQPFETKVIGTGIHIVDFSLDGLEEDFILECQVRPRSGKSKKGILIHLGTADIDYRAEIGVTLTNIAKEEHLIRKGDRIGQLVCALVYRPKCIPVANIKRTSGYGSTGI